MIWLAVENLVSSHAWTFFWDSPQALRRWNQATSLPEGLFTPSRRLWRIFFGSPGPIML